MVTLAKAATNLYFPGQFISKNQFLQCPHLSIPESLVPRSCQQCAPQTPCFAYSLLCWPSSRFLDQVTHEDQGLQIWGVCLLCKEVHIYYFFVLGLAAMEVIFFIACCPLWCLFGVSDQYSIWHMCFSYFWAVLTIALRPSLFHTLPPARRLGMHKKWGGHITWTTDPKWLKGYSMSYSHL